MDRQPARTRGLLGLLLGVALLGLPGDALAQDIGFIVRIGQQFQHVVKRSPALTGGNLYQLNEFFECLCRCQAIVVESEMQLLW